MYYMEYLNNYHIYELRNLARELGVHSPTTLRKNDLIKEIKKSSNNNNFTKSNRGRPPKTFTAKFNLQQNFLTEYENQFENFIQRLELLKIFTYNIYNEIGYYLNKINKDKK